MGGALAPRQKALSSVSENRGGWYRILESFSGAWQNNVEVNHDQVLAYHAVYACMTLIASDIAKLRVKLVQKEADDIWSETANSAFSPVLRKPNGFQNRIQFWENWIMSKLARGNTYVLKQRDGRGVVIAFYVLDPTRVQVLVSDSGDVFYRLSSDNMVGLTADVTVPAREIVHDRFNCLFHPLIGTSPIFACGLAATQGLNIQNGSAAFFGNRAVPSGVLSSPTAISNETAARLKAHWETNYSGPEGVGKVAVLGDGLKFEQMAMTSVDAQLIEQLKWTAEVVCSTFHVPPYKIGVGQMPTYNNIQSLNVEYYSQCLQRLIEDAELCLDEGLGIGEGVATGGVVYGTEFDLDNLLRMDSVTQMEVLKQSGGVLTIDEMRRKLSLPKTEGGGSVYLQEQNYSLAALAKRDALEDPFNRAVSAPAAPPAPEEDDPEPQQRAQLALFEKSFREALNV